MGHFVVLLALSLALYLLVSPLILSIISLPSVLLGVLSLTPLIGWSYQKIKNFANESLETNLKLGSDLHKKNDIFIKKKWPSESQIDISKEDLERWAQRAIKRIEEIDSHLIRFNHNAKSWKEHTWIRKENLQKEKLELIPKLQAQKKTIQSNLDCMVASIPSKVETLILKIKPDFRNAKQFVPHMEPGQLEKLTYFVNKYGSEQTKNSFAQNTNLINLFVNALSLENELDVQFIYKKPINEAIMPTPWGGYSRLEAQFAGWHNLIKGWMIEGEKKEAMTAVLLLLEGKLKLSPRAFDEKLRILENDRLGSRLRTHLFLLLDSSAYTKLVNPEDEKKIKDWYLTHKAEILKAKQLMEAIFSDPNTPNIPPDQELEKYFHLLDSAVLISDIQFENSFQNLVRHYFKTYEGDHPSAHIFLRFIPEGDPERIELTKSVLLKRLEWFIRLACSGILFEARIIKRADISLFNDDRVHIDREAFRFIDEKIRESRYYKEPYKPAFEHFLTVWSQHGLCSLDLKKEYVSKSPLIGVCGGI